MIYVHVPFCRSFCTYCDFYSEVCGGCCDQLQREAALFGRYTDDLCAEIRARRDEIVAAYAVRTLYIGGGTPSVLPLECLQRIVEKLREVEGAALADGADGSAGADRDWEEFTVEVNPEDIVERGPSYVEGLLELGVNRISMGVQSLDDGMLRWMNRRHSADGTQKAWRILSSVRADLQKWPKMTVSPSENGGIPSKSAKNDGRLSCKDGEQHPDLAQGGPLRDGGLSLSIDLISGVPGMDCAMLERTLDEVLEWRPEHISAYQLSVEEGSALARMIAEGRVAELPDEECRAQYDLICRKLAAAGYHHYEISNWALPGHEAVHNSAYWTRQPYVGLGPGAHSLEKLPQQKGPKTSDPPAKNEGAPSKTAENAGAAEEDKGSDGRVPREIRKWNSRRPTGWGEEGREVLTEEEIHEETVMLLARTDRGPIPERDWFVADELIADLL
ncbi:MAG: coproporphyrinogen III oxidase family protein [Bacteroidales bacterium]|nr:coproporphyrinogen III oxidase family protein [Bacteroidales bacterium]